jgi:hypothetical protein
MEKQILAQVEKAMGEAITKELVGYNKPLSKLTERVIEENSTELFTLINDEFASLLNGDGFKDALREALQHKLAKTLIARMGGELEKQVNELKQNPQTRAKITLAISQIVEEL